MRAERTVSTPREERVHRAVVGGRRNTGDLYGFRTCGASTVDDRTRTYRFRFFIEDFETGSRRKLPTNPGQETGTGLTGLCRASPEPAIGGAAPPTKLRISETP